MLAAEERLQLVSQRRQSASVFSVDGCFVIGRLLSPALLFLIALEFLIHFTKGGGNFVIGDLASFRGVVRAFLRDLLELRPERLERGGVASGPGIPQFLLEPIKKLASRGVNRFGINSLDEIRGFGRVIQIHVHNFLVERLGSWTIAAI